MTAHVIEFPQSAIIRSCAEREYLEQCLAAARQGSANEQEAWDNAVRVCACSWEIVSRKTTSVSESRP